jgi:hypothetical protein
MPDITIVKLKIRRGSDAQRKSVVLEQGELGYTTDTGRVFIGNGVKFGGNIVGNIIHNPTSIANNRVNQANAVQGDIIYDNSLLWQLTGTDITSPVSWSNISTRCDNSLVTYNGSNRLTLVNNSIGPAILNNTIVNSQGALNFNNSTGLSANVDGTYVTITSNRLTINPIDESKIKSTALSRGLQGGDGTKLSLKVDDSIFGFNTNTLTITALPSDVVTVDSLSSTFVGAGLQVQGGGISTIVQSYDSSSFDVDINTLRLKSIITPATTTFENITYNSFGQVTGTSSTIATTFSGFNSGTNGLFNGRWNQTTFSNQTLLTAISSNPAGTSTARIALSSAGFIAINTKLGDRFAIPVFRY